MLVVQKYGGTSVGSIEKLEAVADRIVKAHKQYQQLAIIVSAMGGETDRLQALADKISQTPSMRELDVLLSTGEQITIALLSMALQKRSLTARSFTGRQAGILTDGAHNKARINNIDVGQLREVLDKGEVAVIAGFQGTDGEGNITTLGRGGSDTTAVAIAAKLGADECQIYTDVDGVYTADPRIVPSASRLNTVTYEEMLEMASLGAKVLQIRSVEFAEKYNIKLRVSAAFEDGPGTLISHEETKMEDTKISGIAHNRDEAKLTILGVPDTPGIAYQILGPIAEANIEVDMVIQNISENNTTDFTFTVHRRDYEQAHAIVCETTDKMGARKVEGNDTIVKISLVGVGMRSHAGIASKMFKVLADEGINIQMISTSEIKISVVVLEKYLELGIRTLHQAFQLERDDATKDE